MTAVDERLGKTHSLVPPASLLTGPDVTKSYGRQNIRNPGAFL